MKKGGEPPPRVRRLRLSKRTRNTRCIFPSTGSLPRRVSTPCCRTRCNAGIDLHAGQLQGFFDIPVDNLTGIALLAGYFREVLACDTESSPPTIVAPDVGGVVRARKFAGILKTDLAVVDKRRSHEVANLCEVMDVIGDVQGKTAIMVDDIIDTAGTICNAAALLKERGAVKIFACATHGVLSGPALERLEHSAIDSVILTDTIPLPESKKSAKIVQLSIAPLFAEVILRIHNDRSVSSLFD